jgi:benzodiazapine receptor
MRDDSAHSLSSRAHERLGLVKWLAATFLVAMVSTVLTAPAIPTWYAALAKPSFNPPNQLFGPVWTVLYALMAIAAWLVWKRPDSATRSRALSFFWIQLALNFGWSLLFFHLHRIGAAFAEIILLWLAILMTTLYFFRLCRTAGWLLVPYLSWVAFAIALNYAIWRRN